MPFWSSIQQRVLRLRRDNRYAVVQHLLNVFCVEISNTQQADLGHSLCVHQALGKTIETRYGVVLPVVLNQVGLFDAELLQRAIQRCINFPVSELVQ